MGQNAILCLSGSFSLKILQNAGVSRFPKKIQIPNLESEFGKLQG
jgi:hypothetical protein